MAEEAKKVRKKAAPKKTVKKTAKKKTVKKKAVRKTSAKSARGSKASASKDMKHITDDVKVFLTKEVASMKDWFEKQNFEEKERKLVDTIIQKSKKGKEEFLIALKILKLENSIRSVKHDLPEKMQRMGERVYALKTHNKISVPEIDSECESIKKIYEEAAKLEKQIADLKKERKSL